MVHAEDRSAAFSDSLRRLRQELGQSVEEQPAQLSARFERYLEAVALRCGSRLDAARTHLEVGFERMTDGLVASGGLESKSFRSLCDALDRAASGAHSPADLFGAYRTAVADLSLAVQKPVAARRERNLRSALEYIQQHYAEPLRLEKVARIAGFGPDHFSALFKAQEQVSFAEYVRRLRLERAKQLLTDTELGVARVAELAGFGSAQYFCHSFRRHVGMTPRDHRENSRKSNRRRAQKKRN
jgi:AraC-like DNA-binding protein